CSEEPSKGNKAKAKKSRCSRSSRAGLLFPVSRVDRRLRRGHFAERLGATAPVYLAAVLQCVTHNTMDEAAKISKKKKQQHISSLHLKMAIQKSSELKKLMRGGVRRQRLASLSKKKTTKSTKRCP
ncbi:H2A protein, partial [Columbina picui]|nr:H2A protein [Columbina picui]